MLRLFGSLFLFCFTLSSVVEARTSSAPRQFAVAKKKAGKRMPRKKGRAIPTNKRKPPAGAARKALLHKKRLVAAKPVVQPVAPKPVARKPVARKSIARKPVAAKPVVQPVAAKPVVHQPVAAKPAVQLPVAAKPVARKPVAAKPVVQPVAAKPSNAFSLLTSYTQKNARLGGMDSLFSRNLLGQGQTVAVLEFGNTWAPLQSEIHNESNDLSGLVRKNYKRNFLPPIGYPESGASDVHGSLVASVVLDLAPQAKVLPVSYDASGQYDTSDALLSLTARQDVSVINISCWSYDNNYWQGTNISKYVNAFAQVARAGKAVVLSAGNGQEIFNQVPYGSWAKMVLENLDSETRQSVILAGNLDPSTGRTAESSSLPGTLAASQETFLFAPGSHQQACHKARIDTGTSFSAPYICAALADLLSKPGVTPKRAVKALKDTAEIRLDGRLNRIKVVRANRALELLEMTE